jgi:hypothetical protein
MTSSRNRLQPKTSTRGSDGKHLKPGPPMTLSNMRANGVHAVTAQCEACGHQADVSVDAMPALWHSGLSAA